MARLRLDAQQQEESAMIVPHPINSPRDSLPRLRAMKVATRGARESRVVRDDGFAHAILRAKQSFPRGKRLFPRGKRLFPRAKRLFPRSKQLFPRSTHLFPRRKQLLAQSIRLFPGAKCFF